MAQTNESRQLTEKQEFWLIQLGKFVLFTVIWFLAWYFPIYWQLQKEFSGVEHHIPFAFIGMAAYPIVLILLAVTDCALIRIYKRQWLSCLVIFSVEIILLWQNLYLTIGMARLLQAIFS